MDKSKQPGIFFDNIIVVDLKFTRSPKIENTPQMSITVDTKPIIKESTLIYTINFYINKEVKNPLIYFYCKVIGFFSTKEEANMTLEKFSKHNAPALMFPYIRELLSNITVRSGINPIILPPINLTAIKKKKKMM